MVRIESEIRISNSYFLFSINMSDASNAVERVDESVQFSFVTIVMRLEFRIAESPFSKSFFCRD